MKKSPGKGREVKTMPFWLGVIILGASALGVVIAMVGLFRLQLEICLIGQLIRSVWFFVLLRQPHGNRFSAE